MKQVTAVIKPFKLNDVKAALELAPARLRCLAAPLLEEEGDACACAVIAYRRHPVHLDRPRTQRALSGIRPLQARMARVVRGQPRSDAIGSNIRTDRHM